MPTRLSEALREEAAPIADELFRDEATRTREKLRRLSEGTDAHIDEGDALEPVPAIASS